ncbi:MAG: hypothetical protein LBR80_17720 [Deltaproteobacteria bacterium]|nr:hypothetical protein [Deltaproteobacteria bacterium]
MRITKDLKPKTRKSDIPIAKADLPIGGEGSRRDDKGKLTVKLDDAIDSKQIQNEICQKVCSGQAGNPKSVVVRNPGAIAAGLKNSSLAGSGSPKVVNIWLKQDLPIGKLFEHAKLGTLPKDFDQWDRTNGYGWSIAHESAKCCTLPHGFDRWELTDNDGRTVAEIALGKGPLPMNFELWELPSKDGQTLAHLAARIPGRLPGNFTRWKLAVSNGWTVAHEAAKAGTLPDTFKELELTNDFGRTVGSFLFKAKGTDSKAMAQPDQNSAPSDKPGRAELGLGEMIRECYITQALAGKLTADFLYWHLADDTGRTIAHIVAKAGTLPAGFELWELTSRGGWSVAHEGARHNKLPECFNRWDILDAKLRSVAEITLERGHLPPSFNRWMIPASPGCACGPGRTIAHLAARFNRLPDDFQDYGLTGEGSWTVAQEAERSGTLPKGFDRWDLIGKDGHCHGRNDGEFDCLA